MHLALITAWLPLRRARISHTLIAEICPVPRYVPSTRRKEDIYELYQSILEIKPIKNLDQIKGSALEHANN